MVDVIAESEGISITSVNFKAMLGRGFIRNAPDMLAKPQTFMNLSAKMNGVGIAEWKDIPLELLLRIVILVDDRTAIVASGVCSGWRDAICFDLTQLCLSWCRKNMNNLVLSLAPKFTKLQTLILHQEYPQLEDDAVETISRYCRDMQDLDFSKILEAIKVILHHACNASQPPF
ncbi:F-box protein SKP2A [Hibiscus syriacus]|uniref:F-box protein SKP2A n=1 Tax=Hibiscus syriacus TaxID=106335 RepID=A0A6A2XQ68_HIBSY|nr:F-box protein SKP2A [Hibiscus syriacus]